jgi:hypothetical protein
MARWDRSEWRPDAEAAAEVVSTSPARDLSEKEGEIEVLERHPHRTLSPSIPQDRGHSGAFGQAIRRDHPDHATVAQRRLCSPLLVVADGGVDAFRRSGPGIGQARQALVFRNEKLLDTAILCGGVQVFGVGAGRRIAAPDQRVKSPKCCVTALSWIGFITAAAAA